jgi:hypothetical protein
MSLLLTFVQTVGKSRLLGGVTNNWLTSATWGLSSITSSISHVLATGRSPLLLQQQQRGLASKKVRWF